MIPLIAVLGFRTRNHHLWRLWLPVFIVWLLLLPFVLLLLPFFFIACVVVRMDPFRTLARGWQLIAALRGVRVEVNDPRHYVLLRLI